MWQTEVLNNQKIISKPAMTRNSNRKITLTKILQLENIRHDILFHIMEFVAVDEILVLQNVSRQWNSFLYESPMFQRRTVARLVGVETQMIQNSEKELVKLLNYFILSTTRSSRCGYNEFIHSAKLLHFVISSPKFLAFYCNWSINTHHFIWLVYDKESKTAKSVQIDANSIGERMSESIELKLGNIRWMKYNSQSKQIVFKHKSLLEVMDNFNGQLNIGAMFKLAFSIFATMGVVTINETENNRNTYLFGKIEECSDLRGNVKLLNGKWIDLEEYRRDTAQHW